MTKEGISTDIMDGIEGDGTIRGRAAETHYCPLIDGYCAKGYACLIGDHGPYDVEIRISIEKLEGAVKLIRELMQE